MKLKERWMIIRSLEGFKDERGWLELVVGDVQENIFYNVFSRIQYHPPVTGSVCQFFELLLRIIVKSKPEHNEVDIELFEQFDDI